MISQKGFAPIFILVAILVATTAGGGYYYYSQNQPTPTEVNTTVDTVSPLNQSEFDLVLENPTGDTVIDAAMVVVQGKTAPGASVVMFTETDEESVEAGLDGKFAGTINLEVGINSLVVTAYGENGEEKSVNLDLIYDN